MKKLFYLFFIAAIIATLPGCSEDQNPIIPTASDKIDVPDTARVLRIKIDFYDSTGTIYLGGPADTLIYDYNAFPWENAVSQSGLFQKNITVKINLNWDQMGSRRVKISRLGHKVPFIQKDLHNPGSFDFDEVLLADGTAPHCYFNFLVNTEFLPPEEKHVLY